MLVPDDAASPTVTLVGGGAAQIVGRKHGALVLQASCKVSKVHCQIWMTADGIAYMSESSANGTWINGVRMQKDLAYSLETGDQISFPAPPGVTMPTLTFTAPGEPGCRRKRRGGRQPRNAPGGGAGRQQQHAGR